MPPRTAVMPARQDTTKSSTKTGTTLLAVGLLLIGLNLRIGVASIGPVINSIRESLGLSATAVSLLTGLPVFVFGAFAFFTPVLTKKFGMHRLLGITLLVLAIGIGVRLHPSLLALFAGTVLVGAAIAVGNVLMPAAVKQNFPHKAGLMMGLYSTALFLGASAASGLTAPLVTGLNGNWRAALGIWAIPALIALVVWLPFMKKEPTTHSQSGTPVTGPSIKSLFTDPTALAVTVFMGLQSVSYYTLLTWAPTILQDAGVAVSSAGLLLAYSAFPGILTSLITPAIAVKVRPQWLPVAVAAALTATAYVGLLVAPAQGALLWMTLLGLGQGASISLSLTYIVWRSPDTSHTRQLSTMAQGFGYLLAGLGPIVVGALYNATHGWNLPIAVLGVLLAVQFVAGALASRPVFVRARS